MYSTEKAWEESVPVSAAARGREVCVLCVFSAEKACEESVPVLAAARSREVKCVLNVFSMCSQYVLNVFSCEEGVFRYCSRQ